MIAGVARTSPLETVTRYVFCESKLGRVFNDQEMLLPLLLVEHSKHSAGFSKQGYYFTAVYHKT